MLSNNIDKCLVVLKNALKVFFAFFLCVTIVLICFPSLRIHFSIYYWIRFVNSNLLPVLMHSFHSRMLYHELVKFFSFQAVVTYFVFSGLALIYLFNTDIINLKIKRFIKHFFRSGISLSPNESNIDIKSAIPASLNVFFLFFSCFLAVLYFYFIFSQTAVIHPETYHTFARQLRQGVFIRELIPVVFNMVNFEGLAYRPRVMSFLVDYINVNSVAALNRIFPFWGMRLVFNVISVPLAVFSVYLLLDYFFKTMPVGVKLFLSVLPLFSASFMTEVGSFYRSANHLLAPLSLFLLYYFLKNSGVFFEKRNILKLTLPLFLVFLCTVFNEQLVAIIVYFAFAAVLLSVIKKRVYSNAVVFSGAVVCFLFWFHVAGRRLFGMFTTTASFVSVEPSVTVESSVIVESSGSFVPAATQAMVPHFHRFVSFLNILSPANTYDLVRVYFELISTNIMHFSFVIITVLILFVIKGKKQHDYKWLQIPIFILILSFLISCAVVLGHVGLIPRGWVNTRYQIASFFLFYIGAVYLFFHLVFSYSNKILTSVIFLSLCIVVFVNNNNNTRAVENNALTGTPPYHFVLPKEQLQLHGDQRIIDLHNFTLENNINQNFVFLVDIRFPPRRR